MASHPIQPLAPRHQAGARRTAEKMKPVAEEKKMSVKQEILRRQQIDQRVQERLEKLHETVSAERQARRLKRQNSNPVAAIKEIRAKAVLSD